MPDARPRTRATATTTCAVTSTVAACVALLILVNTSFPEEAIEEHWSAPRRDAAHAKGGPDDGLTIIEPQRRLASIPSKPPTTRTGLRREFVYELDQPRERDEAEFAHVPKSAGGVLQEPKYANEWGDVGKACAKKLYEMFLAYDQDEHGPETLPIYGTACVGVDCEHVTQQMLALDIGIGHFILVHNSDEFRWTKLFGILGNLFPGRFSLFTRTAPRLSCAESWNLILRIGFTLRPMPDQVFIANADWRPVASPGTPNNMARYAALSRTVLDNVANRYMHFSSFSVTRRGYLELGYFDENLWPSYGEDVEYHLRAVSKDMGTLGLYPNWKEGSAHANRAATADAEYLVRESRVARLDYILRKWDVKVTAYRDFVIATPFRWPFSIPHIRHNNSWVRDPVHRKCCETGDGPKMANSGRCFWDPTSLYVMIPGDYHMAERLTMRRDSFPGLIH